MPLPPSGMKRAARDEDDDDGDETPSESSGDESSVEMDQGITTTRRPLVTGDRLRREIVESDREDRPVAIFMQGPTTFRYYPKTLQHDPFSGLEVLYSSTPTGTGLETVEYNLRHAIERRDEAGTTSCLVEMFRMFVYLNRAMRRVTNPMMDRQSRLSIQTKYGPFENYLALGLHQRIWAQLISICIRQVGMACPTALSSVLELWRLYELTLFCHPFESLARLLSIGAVLCHVPKDGSVAYARLVFQDTSKMRNWRNEVVKSGYLIGTAMAPHEAQAARAVLNLSSVYFNNRSRLRRYQAVNILHPHPEYADQGGAMRFRNVRAYVEGIRKTMPPTNEQVQALLCEAEELMQVLGAHINNFYDRDGYEVLQVDVQVFLYLFQTIVHKIKVTVKVDEWLSDSDGRVQASPLYVRWKYASSLYAMDNQPLDLLAYGVIGEVGGTQKKKVKRGPVTAGTLMEQLQSRPPVVARVHVQSPPSILRTADTNVAYVAQSSLAQRNRAIDPFVSCFRKLYELERNWAKWKSLESRSMQEESLPILMDTEVYDPESLKVVYTCPVTGITAAQVVLQGKAVVNLSPQVTAKRGRTEVVDCAEGTASFVAECLWGGPEEEAMVNPLQALLVGPWDVAEIPRLETMSRDMGFLKNALDVAPDVMCIKKMMLQSFPHHNGRHRLGRVYAWILVVPRLPNAGQSRVVKTVRELKGLGKTYGINDMVRALCRPTDLVNAGVFLERTSDPQSPWTIADLYVSFVVCPRSSKIELADVRIHVVVASLPGMWPSEKGLVDIAPCTCHSLQALSDRLYEMDAVHAGKRYALAKRVLEDAIQADPTRFSFLGTKA